MMFSKTYWVVFALVYMVASHSSFQNMQEKVPSLDAGMPLKQVSFILGKTPNSFNEVNFHDLSGEILSGDAAFRADWSERSYVLTILFVRGKLYEVQFYNDSLVARIVRALSS